MNGAMPRCWNLKVVRAFFYRELRSQPARLR
jgi:hypothetical protein